MTNSEFQEIGMYLQIAQIADQIQASELKGLAVDFARYKLDKSGPTGLVTEPAKIVEFEKNG